MDLDDYLERDFENRDDYFAGVDYRLDRRRDEELERANGPLDHIDDLQELRRCIAADAVEDLLDFVFPGRQGNK